MSQAGVDGVRRQFARAARRASFFCSTAATSSPSFRTAQAASFSKPPMPRMIILFPSCVFSILAQVSRSATVRLNTSFPAAESGSTQK